MVVDAKLWTRGCGRESEAPVQMRRCERVSGGGLDGRPGAGDEGKTDARGGEERSGGADGGGRCPRHGVRNGVDDSG